MRSPTSVCVVANGHRRMWLPVWCVKFTALKLWRENVEVLASRARLVLARVPRIDNNIVAGQVG